MPWDRKRLSGYVETIQLILEVTDKTRSPVKCYWKLFFLFLNQNIYCGYSKEPSKWDASFEHPKHMFKLMGKKIITILHSISSIIWTYEYMYLS